MFRAVGALRDCDCATSTSLLPFFPSSLDVDTQVSELFNLKVSELAVSAEHRQILSVVGRRIQDDVQSSGYNWIRPSLWSSVFTSHALPRAIKAS